MKSTYRVNDHQEMRSQAFLNIKRIDDFYVKNFPRFESVLRHNNIGTEKDYYAFVSDPAIEMSEQARVLSSVNTLKQLKALGKKYNTSKEIKQSSTLMEIQEAIVEQRFVQDTGVELYLDIDSSNTGILHATLHAVQGQPQSIKLPFNIHWRNESSDEHDSRQDDIRIGSIHLLDGGKRFPRLYQSLKEFEFTEESNIGLMVDTGLSINDLKDRAILMKMNAVEFYEVSELLAFGTNYNLRYPNTPPPIGLSAV